MFWVFIWNKTTLEIDLEGLESRQLLKILVATLEQLFGCIDKQLFLNLLAQSIYAYKGDDGRTLEA